MKAMIRNSRAKQWLACCLLGVLALLPGCTTGRQPIGRINQDQLRVEFDQCVTGASADFANATVEAAADLEVDVTRGFDLIEKEFVQLCLDSDGYLERRKGVDVSRGKLEDFVRVAVTDLLQESLARFADRYWENLGMLERRLLVTTSFRAEFQEQLKAREWLVVNYAPQADPGQLRGSSAVKMLDDAASWVPLVGDAYDLAKLTVYDPRESAIKKRATAYINEQREYWIARIRELSGASVTAQAVEADCRRHFDPRLATTLLEAA
jgi:hypothetical protein